MDLQLAEKARHRANPPINQDILQKLEQRLGRLHAKQRLGIEEDHEGRVFGQGINFFHPENWYLSPSIIRKTLKLTGPAISVPGDIAVLQGRQRTLSFSGGR